jgi:hypothetical protein
MLSLALFLLLPSPQNAAAPAVASDQPKVAVSSDADRKAADSRTAGSPDGAKDALSASAKAPAESAALPSMPTAKVPDAAAAGSAAPAGFLATPVKPALGAIHETPTQRKVWYALAFAGHSGAAFDAWSTRRAISSGAGAEANPLLRPFAHSGALYAATQVSPAVMDLLGKKMMTSQHKWVRRMWWLPQTAGASISFAAGAHNVGIVQ